MSAGDSSGTGILMRVNPFSKPIYGSIAVLHLTDTSSVALFICICIWSNGMVSVSLFMVMVAIVTGK
jgi:hypothetical protein